MNTEWELSLFEVGELQTCVLSYLFAPCAMAYARHQLDESPVIFNLFCTSVCANRWIIRTAYGINGEAATGRGFTLALIYFAIQIIFLLIYDFGHIFSNISDMLHSIVFFPCVANQTLQTSIIRRNPTSNGGRSYNIGRWQVPAMTFFEDKSSWDSNLLFSAMCAPCAVGILLERTIGMPFW